LVSTFNLENPFHLCNLWQRKIKPQRAQSKHKGHNLIFT
jgi:hypothetical protein